MNIQLIEERPEGDLYQVGEEIVLIVQRKWIQEYILLATSNDSSGRYLGGSIQVDKSIDAKQADLVTFMTNRSERKKYEKAKRRSSQ